MNGFHSTTESKNQQPPGEKLSKGVTYMYLDKINKFQGNWIDKIQINCNDLTKNRKHIMI